MDKIIVDNIQIDPYFILDVVLTDSEEFVTKSFRKKAKIWHPDRISKKERLDNKRVEEVTRYFKILVESYQYIINKKKSFNNLYRENIITTKNTNIQSKSIDNSEELSNFNEEFSKISLDPSNFGYSTQRIQDEKEYDDFNYKPYRLFEKQSKFDTNQFNKAFEYQKQSHEKSDLTLYHTTTDGFNPYNGSDLSGISNVSSYNGIMIVGDNYGQSGVGYYDSSYSDYKQSFNNARNPESALQIPDVEQINQKKLSKKQTDKEISIQIERRKISFEKDITLQSSFKSQEKNLIKQQEVIIRKKIEDDKKFILEFQNMFSDKNMINDAINGKLLTSPSLI